MAEYLPLEDLMIFALKRDFNINEATNYFSRYFSLKGKLEELLEWIRSNEPSLSDHSMKHVNDVLENAYKLLGRQISVIDGSEEGKAQYTGIDLYILCTSILFHDVGNFFKREYHNQKIQEIINNFFNDFFYAQYKREKQHIITAGRAHTGKGGDGTNDTLKDVPESEHSAGHEIKLRSIAAIVRLADELAEGPQRTCHYMRMMGMFPPESDIYHRYAECTHMYIDANNGRINIAYEIEINENKKQDFSQEDRESLREFLRFIYKRIFKLDQERKYCGYYCDTLKSIKETQVSFKFHNQNIPIDFKLNPLILTDLTVPGDKAKSIVEGRNDLDIDAIVDGIGVALSKTSLLPKTSSDKEEIAILPEKKTGWLTKLLGAKK